MAVRRRDGKVSFASIYQQLPGGLVDLTLHEPPDCPPKTTLVRGAQRQGSARVDPDPGTSVRQARRDEVEGPANPWTSPTGAWTYHHGHITDMPRKEVVGKEEERANNRARIEGRVRKIVPLWQVGKIAGASSAHDFSEL